MRIRSFCLMALITLCLVTAGAPTAMGQDECESVDAKVETTASGGQNEGRAVVVITKGDRSSAKFIFCEAGGKVLNENDFSKPEIGGLSKGRYLCIVNTPKCSKQVFFNID